MRDEALPGTVSELWRYPASSLAGERLEAMTDAGPRTLSTDGPDVLVESGAGLGAGITDDDYEGAGAKIVSVADAWAAELVVKV